MVYVEVEYFTLPPELSLLLSGVMFTIAAWRFWKKRFYLFTFILASICLGVAVFSSVALPPLFSAFMFVFPVMDSLMDEIRSRKVKPLSIAALALGLVAYSLLLVNLASRSMKIELNSTHLLEVSGEFERKLERGSLRVLQYNYQDGPRWRLKDGRTEVFLMSDKTYRHGYRDVTSEQLIQRIENWAQITREMKSGNWLGY